jgi:hypothetical protein
MNNNATLRLRHGLVSNSTIKRYAFDLMVAALPHYNFE